MQKFVNLSPRDSKDIDKAIYKNALQLKRDGCFLARKRKSYSSATSLLILSSEELIKATLVLLHSKNCEVYKIEGAKMFFSNHKIRHQIAQLIEMGAGFIDSLKIWDERKKKDKLFKTKHNWLNNILNGAMEFAEASKPFVQSIERIKKIEEFNTLKNQGLYVDYQDKLFTPQIIINKEQYLQTKLIVDRMFSFYKGLIIIYHPSLINHLPQNEINKYQSDLKLFINNALIGFSFKKD